MESYEVIRRAVNTIGVKAVAPKMRLSAALIYKWCQEPSSEDHADASGSRNPLDRVKQLYELTGDVALIGWLCRQAGGYLVKNPEHTDSVDRTILNGTQRMIKEFSEVLGAVAESVTDGDGVDSQEAKRIRSEWEELKCLAESFVVACERGYLSLKGKR